VIEGIPAVLVTDGRVLDEVLRVERIERDELLTSARQQGIADLSQVRLGVLEVDGRISFIQREGAGGPPPDAESRAA
jgi:uncharacterized membrane protein YcaP (DUF421 family)